MFDKEVFFILQADNNRKLSSIFPQPVQSYLDALEGIERKANPRVI
jgi:hypothetical protein